jgi:hypothetical protein
MRRILVGLGLAMCSVSLAAAQSTTTTVAPTSSTTTTTSTSTTASSVISSSTTSTFTTTSTSVGPTCGNTSVASYDPRACARCGKSEGTSKEVCRQDCCSSDFALLSDSCNAFGDCDDGAWSDFVDGWNKAGTFYNTCLREKGDNTDKFATYNLPDSCREYVGGCKATGLRHVRQCADVDRCVTCCRTTLRRWRHSIAGVVRRKSANPRRCQKAIRCLRRASRKAEACRNACRRAPTCGQDELRTCLDKTKGGRDVLRCFGKCADKCHKPDAYPWCIQACQGLNQCNAFDDCTSGSSAETDGRCLSRDDRGACVPVTTTSTSTSSSTSSSVTTTTNTSSTTVRVA